MLEEGEAQGSLSPLLLLLSPGQFWPTSVAALVPQPWGSLHLGMLKQALGMRACSFEGSSCFLMLPGRTGVQVCAGRTGWGEVTCGKVIFSGGVEEQCCLLVAWPPHHHGGPDRATGKSILTLLGRDPESREASYFPWPALFRNLPGPG